VTINKGIGTLSYQVKNLITLETQRLRGDIKVHKAVNGHKQIDEEPLYCDAGGIYKWGCLMFERKCSTSLHQSSMGYC